jgi:hypothetical protein
MLGSAGSGFGVYGGIGVEQPARASPTASQTAR